MAAPALGWAQYKCKDERGRVQYSNLPRPGCTDMAGKPVDLSRPPAAKAKPSAKAAAPSKGAPRPAPKKSTVIGALPADPKQRATDCRALQQQRDWLMSPAGRKVEMHSARVAQVNQAMRGCK